MAVAADLRMTLIYFPRIQRLKNFLVIDLELINSAQVTIKIEVIYAFRFYFS